MNEFKRRFLLWHVRREIKKMKKKHDIKTKQDLAVWWNKDFPAFDNKRSLTLPEDKPLLYDERPDKHKKEK